MHDVLCRLYGQAIRLMVQLSCGHSALCFCSDSALRSCSVLPDSGKQLVFICSACISCSLKSKIRLHIRPVIKSINIKSIKKVDMPGSALVAPWHDASFRLGCVSCIYRNAPDPVYCTLLFTIMCLSWLTCNFLTYHRKEKKRLD